MVIKGLLLVTALLEMATGGLLCAAENWQPPPPSGQDRFDWIELKSGEWLKGRIKSLQDEKLATTRTTP